MAKLYELTDQYVKFNEFVENALESDDLTEDDLQMFVDTLDSIQDSVENKVGNIVRFLKNIKSDIDAHKEEEKKLAQKRKYLENKFEGLKDYTQNMLEFAKIDKVMSGVHGVRLQNNPPSIRVLDENAIPSTYKTPQPDKIESREILADLKQGKDVAGVELVTDKRHLRIL